MARKDFKLKNKKMYVTSLGAGQIRFQYKVNKVNDNSGLYRNSSVFKSSCLRVFVLLTPRTDQSGWSNHFAFCDQNSQTK